MSKGGLLWEFDDDSMGGEATCGKAMGGRDDASGAADGGVGVPRLEVIYPIPR